MCGRNNSRTSQKPVLPIGSDTPETVACWPVRVTNGCAGYNCAQDFLSPWSSQGCFQCPEPFYVFHFSRVTPQPMLRCSSSHPLPTFLLVPLVTTCTRGHKHQKSSLSLGCCVGADCFPWVSWVHKPGQGNLIKR